MEESELTVFNLNRDKEYYKTQVDLLREDVKAKQEEIKATDENKTQMQNEIEGSQKLAATYKNQIDQLREEIKMKQDQVKHLAIKIEALKLKLSESDTEIINLKVN